MTDFETHHAGTADLVKRLRNAAGIDQMEYPFPMCDEAANHIEHLEAALTRANAATAAAYEVAAGIAQNYHEKALEWAKKVRGLDQYIGETDSSRIAAAIRALATPDQTAALDKLIAEAVGSYVEALAWYGEQARLARLIHSEGDAGRNALQADGGKRANAILAASKKGGV